MKLRSIGVCLSTLTASLLVAACDRFSAGTSYDCQAKGESFRYRNGQRLPQADTQAIAFTLTTHPNRGGYDISANAAVPEAGNKLITLDKTRSTDVESVYLYDAIDAASTFRTVSSLVLNLTSGDVRLFHHRWIAPVEWRDSDQYMYTGTCLKAKA